MTMSLAEALQGLADKSGTRAKATVDELKALIDARVGRGVKPTAALYETVPRRGFVVSNLALTSGRLHLVGIDLPAGLPISSISFYAGGTGMAGGVNHWATLYDSALALLRQSTDYGAAGWASGVKKTFDLTSQWVTAYAGLHYLGIMVNAATPPNLRALNGDAVINGEAPIISGSSTTGLTTTAPNPAGALTASSGIPYAFVT